MATLAISSRLSRVLAAFAVVAALLLLIAPPAHAHDELVSTDPSAGSTLDAAPDVLTLTFSADLFAEEGATQVEVTDASGAELADGPPVVSANVVTQQLTGDAAGEIRVLWRVTSGDGHPVSGEFTFTVSTPTPSPTETVTPTPTEQPTETTAPEPTPTVAPSEGDAGAAVPWIIGAVLVAVAAAVSYLLVSRARRKRTLANAESTRYGKPSDR